MVHLPCLTDLVAWATQPWYYPMSSWSTELGTMKGSQDVVQVEQLWPLAQAASQRGLSAALYLSP